MRDDTRHVNTSGSPDGAPDGKKEGGFPANLPPAYVGEGQSPDDVEDPEPTLEPVPAEDLEEEFPDDGEGEREEERREGPRR